MMLGWMLYVVVVGFVLTAGAAEISPPNAAPFSGNPLPEFSSISPADKFGDVETNLYRNSAWNFALDIPARWNSFPPVAANSPYEVVRFFSSENGTHGLIVFRQPYDPAISPKLFVAAAQENLRTKGGFSHFASGETTIGSHPALTLDFDKVRPDGKLWSVREYFIFDGTLGYVLGFGSTNRDAMFGLYDQMAKSFVFKGPPT